MSIFDRPDWLRLYESRFPDHGIINFHVADREAFEILLQQAVERGSQL